MGEIASFLSFAMIATFCFVLCLKRMSLRQRRGADPRRDEALREELAALNERMSNLEKIVTNEEFDLKRKIDTL